MNKIEEALYKKTFDLILNSLSTMKKLLNWEICDDFINDKNYVNSPKVSTNLFWTKKFTNKQKKVILEIYYEKLLLHMLTLLRILEWDFYELEWYSSWVDPEIYFENNRDWAGSLVVLKDIDWNFITDNNLYDNFLWYVMDNEFKVQNIINNW